jgi:hypothetical protein
VAVFNFGIPEGVQGATGPQGPQGIQGIPGLISATAPLSYNAGTQTVSLDTSGFLLKSGNLSGLANLATSRTNLGLGIGDQVEFQSVLVQGSGGVARGLFNQGIYATNSSASVGVILSEAGVNIFGGADLRFSDSSVQTTAYLGGDLKAANNLSDLVSASSARGNLGLGTMATEAASTYLTTSAAASTYLTQSNAATTYAAIASTNTFTASQVIETTSTTSALRVTQLGTGEAFRVEDSASPDSSPFVITADGRVGIATTSVGTNALTVSGATSLVGATSISTSGSTPLTVSVTNTASGVTGQKIDYRGTGDAFLIANNTAEKFVVDKDGNTEIAGTLNVLTAPAAGNSSTLIPTTAWVQAEVPAASTTAAGKVELATDAEAVAGTSATLVLSSSSGLRQRLTASFLEIPRGAMTVTNVGTMGTAQAGWLAHRLVTGTVGACSGRARIFGGSQADQSGSMMSKSIQFGINFSKAIWCSGRAMNTIELTDSNVTAGWYFGKSESDGAGDLSRKSFGWEVTGNSTTRYIDLVVHDGTTLTKVTSSYVVVSLTAFDWEVYSDGLGNVSLFVDGSLVATTSAGPTGDTSYPTTRPVIWQDELRASTTVSTGYDFRFGRGRIHMEL